MVTEGKIGRTKGGYMYSAPKETAEVKKEPVRANVLIKGWSKAAGSSKFVRREHRKDNIEGRQDTAHPPPARR
jgi:hypothetical protein